MDLYAWLAYRTARIPAGREVHVPTESLRAVFAPDMEARADVPPAPRRGSSRDRRGVPDFRVRLEGDRLVLARSRPARGPARNRRASAFPAPAGVSDSAGRGPELAGCLLRAGGVSVK